MTTTDPYDPLQRIADRLDAIDATLGLLLQTLQRLANPPELSGFDAGIPSEAQPRVPTDAGYVYMSGTWKRRDGHGLYDTGSTRSPRPGRLGNPHAPLNPWVRKVPAIREEEVYGEKTHTSSE